MPLVVAAMRASLGALNSGACAMNLHQFAETHQVTNQPPSLDGANLYRIDLPLQQ